MPLMWTLLPHRGNSDAATRNALLERVLTVLPAARIAGLLADREFVGKKWFRFLQANKIVPCIRLKADTRVGSLPVWQLFKTIPAEEVRWWYRPLMVYGGPLRVCAVRDQDGHVLYVATFGRGQDAMQNYAKRWSIETGQHDYGDTSRTSSLSIIEVALSIHRRWHRAPTGSALKTWSRRTSA